MSVLSYTYKSVKDSWPEKKKRPGKRHMRRGTESAGLSLRQAMEKLKVKVEGFAKMKNTVSEKRTMHTLLPL